MKVLIASYDLFGEVGGGQTFYKNLILRHPNIEFHYLRRHEPRQLRRPTNATAIDAPDRPPSLSELRDFEASVPPCAFGQIAIAEQIAKCVAGNRYDLVDTPDYHPCGAFLRPAFRRHDVAVGRIALSMHGVISTSRRLNWGNDGTPPVDLQQVERLQYHCVDLRYFISEFYRDEWHVISPYESHYLDPLWFFDVRKPVEFRPVSERPVLRFIGRTEKRKGPHLFINLLSWLPRDSFEHAEIIGPICRENPNFCPADAFTEMARVRNLPVTICHAYNAQQLDEVYSDRTVTIVPSIYDTLNLVALESLFAGCPTVVGDGAGVCRYLRERFPQLPFTEFSTTRFYTNAPAVAALLTDYDRQRALVAKLFQQLDVQPRGPGIANIYQSASVFDSSSRAFAENWHRSLIGVIDRTHPSRAAA